MVANQGHTPPCTIGCSKARPHQCMFSTGVLRRKTCSKSGSNRIITIDSEEYFLHVMLSHHLTRSTTCRLTCALYALFVIYIILKKEEKMFARKIVMQQWKLFQISLALFVTLASVVLGVVLLVSSHRAAH